MIAMNMMKTGSHIQEKQQGRPEVMSIDKEKHFAIVASARHNLSVEPKCLLAL